MKRLFLMLAFAGTFFLSNAQSSNGVANKSIFDCIYNAPGVPTIQLETNWNKVINQKMNETYVPATITMPCGEKLTLDVRVRARGNMRKQVCYFPPIKIDFKKGSLEKHQLDTSVDKLKVVFQCKEGAANSEYLMREKLAYDIYQVISPNYYILKKQVKIECLSEDKIKYTLDALIVEDEAEIGDRLKGKVIEAGKLSSTALERDIFLRMTFFQYLIGNTDWSIPNKHNVEMIKVPELPKVLPIAYDFDYSALASTPYAVPHESLPIKSVQERYYMAKGLTEDEVTRTAKYLLEKKEDVLKAVDSCEGLDEKAKTGIKKFFNPVWELLENEKQAFKTFIVPIPTK